MKIQLLVPVLVVAVGCGVDPQLPVDPGSPTTEPSQQTELNPHQQQQQELTGFPCDVRDTLQAACAGCHAYPTYIGQFVTRADLVPLATTAREKLVSTTAPMPPYGAARALSTQEREMLVAWFANGAPAGACGPLTKP
ncbi:MAG: hypothetical protein QM817_39800 [Archangium sp.]